MTDSPYDENGLQFAFDQSTLGAGDTCLRYYELRYLDGWQSKKLNVHLLFGGCYATALEHFHKYVATGKSHNEALRKVVREALIATWIDGEPWVSDHSAKTRENLIRTIVWYTEQFRDDPTKIVKLSNGKPAVELSFVFEIDNGYLFCGHMDRLVEYGDKLYVMDQKTTGRTLSPGYYKQFENDLQFSMYSFAGKAVYDMPVKGVIIDAAQIAVGFTRFERGFSFRSEMQLDEWYGDMLKLIEDIREAHRNDYFPMRRASCNNYGGCEFRDVCSRPPEVREQFLKGDFEQTKRWNPLEKR